MRRRGFVQLLLAAPAAMLAACGGTTVYDKNGTSTAIAGIGLPTATPPPPLPVSPAPTRAASAATMASGGNAAPAGDATVINVQGKDFAFMLDKSTAKAGPVRFVFRNMGPSPHNFAVRGDGVSSEGMTINMGQMENIDVTLKAGMYTYICTIAGHEQLGMKGTFTVQ